MFVIESIHADNPTDSCFSFAGKHGNETQRQPLAPLNGLRNALPTKEQQIKNAATHIQRRKPTGVIEAGKSGLLKSTSSFSVYFGELGFRYAEEEETTQKASRGRLDLDAVTRNEKAATLMRNEITAEVAEIEEAFGTKAVPAMKAATQVQRRKSTALATALATTLMINEITAEVAAIEPSPALDALTPPAASGMDEFQIDERNTEKAFGKKATPKKAAKSQHAQRDKEIDLWQAAAEEAAEADSWAEVMAATEMAEKTAKCRATTGAVKAAAMQAAEERAASEAKVAEERAAAAKAAAEEQAEEMAAAEERAAEAKAAEMAAAEVKAELHLRAQSAAEKEADKDRMIAEEQAAAARAEPRQRKREAEMERVAASLKKVQCA